MFPSIILKVHELYDYYFVYLLITLSAFVEVNRLENFIKTKRKQNIIPTNKILFCVIIEI